MKELSRLEQQNLVQEKESAPQLECDDDTDEINNNLLLFFQQLV